MRTWWKIIAAVTLAVAGVYASLAMADAPLMGVVVMHGKGGSPQRNVAELADDLSARGYLVENLEMAWSGDRDYDVDVAKAESEVADALARLRERGAAKLFVAGHSQGGAFALHLAGVLPFDGAICIAPGGNVASSKFTEALGESVAKARALIAEGKGGEKARLMDFEGSKGPYPVVATPADYLTWFDPAGAMNMKRAARAVNPAVPVLWLVAARDYPGLRKFNIPMFKDLPSHPLTRMAEPDSDHIGAPSASLDEIVRWTSEVARQP
ncbi:MAG: alpha/beta fold hydrolase [Chromatiales bacterium]|nr:alpha/beta fold hydrolase [Chromatiales bacterium]